MKALAICGSYRRDGNTAIALSAVLEEMGRAGIETELLQLAGIPIPLCRACHLCEGRGGCVYSDEFFDRLMFKLRSADCIILGSPVYSYDVSANMRAFMERAGMIAHGNPGILKGKLCASVIAVRRDGGTATLDAMNRFLLDMGCILMGTVGLPIVRAGPKGDANDDEEGMERMRQLGRDMAVALVKLN